MVSRQDVHEKMFHPAVTRLIVGMSHRMTASTRPDQAEDYAQDAYLHLLQKKEHLAGKGVSYYKAAVKNHLRDVHEFQARRNCSGTESDKLSDEESVQVPALDDFTQGGIWLCQPMYRLALYLRIYLRMTHREVAEALGMTTGSLYKRIRQAVAMAEQPTALTAGDVQHCFCIITPSAAAASGMRPIFEGVTRGEAMASARALNHRGILVGSDLRREDI